MIELRRRGRPVLAAAGAVVLHRGANRAREERRAALISSLQMPVLKLAAERKGVLTVTDVAASLGWSMSRAEKILRSMDDGWRVSSEVTDEGGNWTADWAPYVMGAYLTFDRVEATEVGWAKGYEALAN